MCIFNAPRIRLLAGIGAAPMTCRVVRHVFCHAKIASDTNRGYKSRNLSTVCVGYDRTGNENDMLVVRDSFPSITDVEKMDLIEARLCWELMLANRNGNYAYIVGLV